MSIFLSTSTHYPIIQLRNTTIPWNLHASMEGLLTFDSGFTSLTLDQLIPQMFDLKSFIHIHWNVLGYLGNH
jgi:membrane-associated PAP2 superfamily phosphatase